MLFFIGQRSGDDEASHSTSRQGSQEHEARGGQSTTVIESEDSLARKSSARMRAMLRDEVLINAQKFKTQVNTHMQSFLQWIIIIILRYMIGVNNMQFVVSDT